MSLLPYAATLRALDSDRCAWRVPALVMAAALLGGWLAWALGAEVSVSVDSTAATIETVSPRWVLAAAADGVLASRSMTPGERVRAGQLLATLDDRELQARLGALAERGGALAAEVEAVAEQQAAARRALDEDRRAQAAASGERDERTRQAASAAALADQVREREARLEAAGLLARADAARGRAEAEQRRQAAAAAALAAAAGAGQGRAALADRTAAAGRLAGELARLRGELAALGAERAGLEQAIALRSLRAPAAGRLAEVSEVRPGTFVTRGTGLATLLPDAPLRVVASFSAPAAAAVRPGQRAWVRLAAGPISAPVVLAATVAGVAPVPRPGGSWEVELALGADAAGRSPLARPGQPCEVEVLVARRTPAALALAVLRGSAAGPAPSAPSALSSGAAP
jgi:membrane fusion protein (multidrug efflux system)